MALLLLVEDERLLRWALHSRLEKAGHFVDDAPTLAAAEEHLKRRRPDVVLLDVNLPDGNGLDFFESQRDKLSESGVIVFTADGRVEDAVRAMKLGAVDFLSKPVNHDELLLTITKATNLHRQRLDAEVSRRSRETQGRVSVVAESPAMKNALRLAETVARAGSTTVLLEGETGVGKEVIARFVHASSPRASAPLQALNCAAVPEQLVESELFGHEKGAFTDAKNSRKGLFEIADGGTVVLDEIGEIPLALQAKLLRFLEERTLRRLGGVREISVDVRIIALTNRSLKELVSKGQFREDLYYRLNVFPIRVPALRERPEDVVPLAQHFARQFGRTCGKKMDALSPELQDRLTEYGWTGNVRELRNVIERAVILENGPILSGSSIVLGTDAAPKLEITRQEEPIVPLEQLEFTMVTRAVRAAGGNQSKASRLLEITRDQLRYRVKRYRDLGTWPSDLTEPS
jgi:two-component system, NtrC family, response regulator AtoC